MNENVPLVQGALWEVPPPRETDVPISQVPENASVEPLEYTGHEAGAVMVKFDGAAVSRCH